jgi:tRNA1(Val) A37 N6-methylase TrmN6
VQALPWEKFAKVVSKLLCDEGLFFVIIPSIRAYTMQKHMEANGLQLIEDTTVFNKEKQLPFRSFLNLKKLMKSQIISKEINCISKAQQTNIQMHSKVY